MTCSRRIHREKEDDDDDSDHDVSDDDEALILTGRITFSQQEEIDADRRFPMLTGTRICVTNKFNFDKNATERRTTDTE